MRLNRVALALSLAAASPLWQAPLAAQSSLLENGTRVRILAPPLEPNPIVGTIEASGPDELSVRLQGGSEVLTIPLDLVSTLERSDGMRSRVWPGALIGFAVGAVTGYGVSACDYGEGCIDDLELIVSPALGLIGAGVGALVGSRIKKEAWEPVAWTVTSTGQTRVTIRLGVGNPGL